MDIRKPNKINTLYLGHYMPYPIHANDKEHQKRTREKIKSDPIRLRIEQMKRREYSLLYKFGITLEQYDQLLQQQNNKCGICGRDIQEVLEERMFAVDHCHSTGQVRGLLCLRCNVGLGMFGDDEDVLVRAIVWLNKPT